jgi:hypothetical protein
MSEPEISHRCLSCGASHRGHALFCPQCGAPLDPPKGDSKVNDAGSAAAGAEANHATDAEAKKVDATATEGKKAHAAEASLPRRRRSDRDEKASAAAAMKVSGNSPQGSNGKSGKSSPPRGGQGDERSKGSRGDKARRNIQRATAAARDVVGDNVRPRVEKIKHASNVVIEEASDDPSLRFILVAGLLFLVFVVLLVISKVI